MMPENKPTVCCRCGAKAVKPRSGKGRTTRYRVMPSLPIPEDVVIPACGKCGSEYLDEETITRLGPVLREVYLAALQSRARTAIDTLAPQYISQRKLECLLGLSQGYLSRLRAGDGNPSPYLVCHLALLCHDPEMRLSELDRFWSVSDESWLLQRTTERKRSR